jgi:hypothetical protein
VWLSASLAYRAVWVRAGDQVVGAGAGLFLRLFLFFRFCFAVVGTIFCLPAAGLSLSSTACRFFLAAMAFGSVVPSATGYSANGASVMSNRWPSRVSFQSWLRAYHLPFSST